MRLNMNNGLSAQIEALIFSNMNDFFDFDLPINAFCYQKFLIIKTIEIALCLRN